MLASSSMSFIAMLKLRSGRRLRTAALTIAFTPTSVSRLLRTERWRTFGSSSITSASSRMYLREGEGAKRER